MVGLLIGIAVFAIAGNLLWKAANRQRSGPRLRHGEVLLPEPARCDHVLDRLRAAADPDLHRQGHGPADQAGGRQRRRRVGRARGGVGISFQPPSVEQYTQDMNTCASRSKRTSRPQPVRPRSPPRRKRSQRIQHGRGRDEGRGPPQRTGCRLLDRAGERTNEVDTSSTSSTSAPP